MILNTNSIWMSGRNTAEERHKALILRAGHVPGVDFTYECLKIRVEVYRYSFS